MGYRSTFVTSDTNIRIPQWFIDKWKHLVFFNGDIPNFPIASKQEGKTYGIFDEIESDIILIIKQHPEPRSYDKVIIAWLGEDGAVHSKHLTANGEVVSDT